MIHAITGLVAWTVVVLGAAAVTYAIIWPRMASRLYSIRRGRAYDRGPGRPMSSITRAHKAGWYRTW